MNVLEKVKETNDRYQLIQRGDHVVAAVSGGADSLALLHLLLELQHSLDLTLTAAHLDHGWGQHSEQAAAHTARYAKRWDVRMVQRRVDAPAEARRKGMGLEEASRRIRYRFLEKTRQEQQADVIALGHHRDDQAETVLLNLIRGAGIAGLSGMSFRRGSLVRPLLRVAKEELAFYCESHGIEAFLDPTNRDLQQRRNRIRHQILPQLEKIQPGIHSRLADLSLVLKDEHKLLTARTEQLGKEVAVQPREQPEIWPLPPELWSIARSGAGRRLLAPSGDSLFVARQRFLNQGEADQRRLVRWFWQKAARSEHTLSFQQVERTRRFAAEEGSGQGDLSLPGPVTFHRGYETLSFIPGQAAEWPYQGALPGRYRYRITSDQETVDVPEAGLTFQCQRTTGAGAVDVAQRIYLTYNSIKWPLTIRNRRPGDRIRLDRNGCQTKKIKELFIHRRLPQHQRERTPLFLDADERILWLPGIALDASLRFQPSEPVLEIQILPEPD